MEKHNTTLKIDLKDLIEVTDSQKYITFANELARLLVTKIDPNGTVQPLTIPISSVQPEEMPFVVFQAPGSFQLLLSRRTLQITSALQNNKSALDIANILSFQIGEVFKNAGPFSESKVRAITHSVSKITSFDSFASMQAFMSKTEYRDVIENMNSLGFNFNYFTNSKIAGSSGQALAYNATVDVNDGKRGIQTTFTTLVGGIDFDKAKYMSIDESAVKEYIKGIQNKQSIVAVLEEIHGLESAE